MLYWGTALNQGYVKVVHLSFPDVFVNNLWWDSNRSVYTLFFHFGGSGGMSTTPLSTEGHDSFVLFHEWLPSL